MSTTPMTELPAGSGGCCPPPPCSRMFCVLERIAPDRGSLKARWQVRLVVDGVKLYPFTIANDPIEAVEAAQARAADFVRGLQDMHNAIANGPIKTTTEMKDMWIILTPKQPLSPGQIEQYDTANHGAVVKH